jgi:hypothetical protein
VLFAIQTLRYGGRTCQPSALVPNVEPGDPVPDLFRFAEAPLSDGVDARVRRLPKAATHNEVPAVRCRGWVSSSGEATTGRLVLPDRHPPMAGQWPTGDEWSLPPGGRDGIGPSAVRHSQTGSPSTRRSF